MVDKSLKDKAVSIKGKQYVQVADRILFFNETYKEGSIQTELVSAPGDSMVIVKATVKPDERRIFTGYSQATWGDGMVNKTAALENAETSAVGRALAMMGIGVIESVASSDEVTKAQTYTERPQASATNPASDKQIGLIKGLLVQLGTEKAYRDEVISQIKTAKQASDAIEQLQEKLKNKNEVK